MRKVLFKFKNRESLEEIANEIPLEVWQDPQGDVVLQISEHECFVYFGCWDENGEPADFLAKLTFDCKEAKYIKSDFVPYKRNNLHNHSCIFIVENSLWLNNYIERKIKRNPLVKNPEKTWDDKSLKHYIIQGHDIYVELISSGYILEKIPSQESGYFKYFIDNA